MLTLLCHVSPRSAELADVLNSADPSLHALACSFEEIKDLHCADMLTQFERDLGAGSTTDAAIWIAVSPTAASAWIRALHRHGTSATHLPHHISALGMGAGTQEVLDEANAISHGAAQLHLRALLLADDSQEPDSQRMLQLLHAHCAQYVGLKKIRIVKGEGGRQDWIDQLRAAGFEVEIFTLYKRLAVPLNESMQTRLWNACEQDARLVFVLPSAAALESLLAYPEKGASPVPNPLESARWRAWLSRQTCLVPHLRLQALAFHHGVANTRVYRSGTIGLLDALKSASEYI
jgi:uroporphyrinogen-III synthase